MSKLKVINRGIFEMTHGTLFNYARATQKMNILIQTTNETVDNLEESVDLFAKVYENITVTGLS